MLASLFFFTSRRRHTRCSRDWSSDVCSSDLCLPAENPGHVRGVRADADRAGREELEIRARAESPVRRRAGQIGRASCREREEMSVVVVSVMKKRNVTSNKELEYNLDILFHRR